ncbi:MAG: hypothetical protein IPG07_13825 [Crocinitomicaceae bacterium]|nr:hypothetical protein [Crocinitomicaceae bacterium]
MLDIFEGKEFTTVSTFTTQESNQDLKFHVEPNRLQLAGKKSASTYFVIDPDQSAFEFENKSLVFADQALLDSVQFPKTDAVYLYDCKFISDDLVKHWTEQNTFLILGHNCSNKLKKASRTNNHLFSIHDISTSGALIFRF